MPKLSTADRELRRSHLLRAALRCFARTGFHVTTIDDVAAEAGVSKGTPYVYFESKAALFRALYEEWDCGLADRIEAAQEALSPEERKSPRSNLRAFLVAVGEQVREEPDTCRVLMEARAQAHYLSAIEETVHASQTQSLCGLEQLIRAGVASGEWPAYTDPELQARLLLAALYGLMDQWHLQPGCFSWREAAAALAAQPAVPVEYAALIT